jgi:hypothetical protein
VRCSTIFHRKRNLSEVEGKIELRQEVVVFERREAAVEWVDVVSIGGDTSGRRRWSFRVARGERHRTLRS